MQFSDREYSSHFKKMLYLFELNEIENVKWIEEILIKFANNNFFEN